MGETTINDQKAAIRETIQEKRRHIPASVIDEDAEGLREHLSMLGIARGARTVSCYYPVISEPNTLPFLEWAKDTDIRVLLPISRVDGLLDWVEYEGGNIAPGLF